mmetsp:Transcript_18431/g.55084  ORF Transcript_18431/g.55084 Transcript_18431/m.55084 type:complete len:335 (+) Transcript_18431:943-1947(+)
MTGVRRAGERRRPPRAVRPVRPEDDVARELRRPRRREHDHLDLQRPVAGGGHQRVARCGHDALRERVAVDGRVEAVLSRELEVEVGPAGPPRVDDLVRVAAARRHARVRCVELGRRRHEPPLRCAARTGTRWQVEGPDAPVVLVAGDLLPRRGQYPVDQRPPEREEAVEHARRRESAAPDLLGPCHARGHERGRRRRHGGRRGRARDRRLRWPRRGVGGFGLGLGADLVHEFLFRALEVVALLDFPEHDGLRVVARVRVDRVVLPDGAPCRAERRVAGAVEPRRALGLALAVGRYVEFDGHIVVVRSVAEVRGGGALGAGPIVLVPVGLHAAEK